MPAWWIAIKMQAVGSFQPRMSVLASIKELHPWVLMVL